MTPTLSPKGGLPPIRKIINPENYGLGPLGHEEEVALLAILTRADDLEWDINDPITFKDWDHFWQYCYVRKAGNKKQDQCDLLRYRRGLWKLFRIDFEIVYEYDVEHNTGRRCRVIDGLFRIDIEQGADSEWTKQKGIILHPGWSFTATWVQYKCEMVELMMAFAGEEEEEEDEDEDYGGG